MEGSQPASVSIGDLQALKAYVQQGDSQAALELIHQIEIQSRSQLEPVRPILSGEPVDPQDSGVPIDPIEQGEPKAAFQDNSTDLQDPSDVAMDRLLLEPLGTHVHPITNPELDVAELQESRRVLWTLLSHLPGMAYRCRWDPAWTMIFVSQGCRELTGYSPADLLNNAAVAFESLIYPLDRQQVRQQIDHALQHRHLFQITYRILTTTGSLKWVWEQGQGIFSEQGELRALEGFIMDITPQKQAEARLEEGKRRFRTKQQRAMQEIQLLQTLISLMSNCPDVEKALTITLEQVQKAIQWTLAEAWVPNPEGTALICSSAWWGDPDRFGELRRARHDLTLVYGSDFPGQIWSAQESVWIEDLAQTLPLTPWIKQSVTAGLRTCLGVPIRGQRRVLAVLIFLQVEPTVHDRRLINLIEAVATQLSHMIRRIEVESVLREREARYRELGQMLQLVIDNIPQAIFWKDQHSVYLGCNRICALDAGLDSPEVIVGKTDYDLGWSQTQADQFYEADQEVIVQNQATHNHISRMRRANGSWAWVRTSKLPFTNDQGEVIGLLGVYEDFSERVEMEAALRESEARLRIALSAARMGVWDWDMVSDHENWSPELREMFEVPEDQPMTFQSFLSCIHPDDRDHVLTTQTQALNEKQDYYSEYRIYLPDGSIRWMFSKGAYLYDQTGEAIKLAGISMDITDWKLAEQAQERSLSLLSATLESTADAIIAVDQHGNANSFNQKFLEMWQLSADFVEQATPTERLQRLAQQTQDPAGFLQRVQDLYASDQAAYDLLELKDGCIIERYTQPQRIAQQVVGRVWSYRDITQRKRTEAELIQAKEAAESANQAKSKFLANMSHELRTPMNAILGFSQLLDRDPDLTPRQRESLQVINRSGEHLLSLINSVLEMSKIEAGRIELYPIPFDLHQLLESIESLFQPRVQAKQLELLLELDPNVPRYVITDENKLRQVLVNLLSNAVKFTHEGGVVVRVVHQSGLIQIPESDQFLIAQQLKSQSIRCRKDQWHRLVFEVEDTGEGIAATELENLFQPFFQSSSGVRAQEGTGLGLSISAQFIQLMGGEIRVQSEVGHGSLFRFDIQIELADPGQVRSVQPKPRVMGLAPDQPVFRILVVDDKQENRDLLAQLLTVVGFETRVAVNGQEAIEIWQAWEPHLIWMDMRMPVMDGYTATRQIKATIQGQATVIIALTASTFEHERASILAAGCDDFVAKPLREDRIFEKMAETLGVQYLYESRDEDAEVGSIGSAEVELDPQALTVMPLDWIVALQEAAVQVDPDLVLQLLDQIPETAIPLQQGLATWVDNFRFDQILQITEAALSDY